MVRHLFIVFCLIFHPPLSAQEVAKGSTAPIEVNNVTSDEAIKNRIR